MFEELFRLKGAVHTASGNYLDGKPERKRTAVRYFAKNGSYRDPQSGALKSEAAFRVKPEGDSSLPEIKAGDLFEDWRGETFEIGSAVEVFNHFDNVFEFVKLTVV